MHAESTQLSDYLRATDVVDADHPTIVAQANELARQVAGEVEQARTLFEWVRDEIPHTRDAGHQVVTCRASDVLREGTGICYAKSHLLAATLRAIGIPAGFCYQRFVKDPPHVGFELHGFNGVYLGSIDRWIRVDPRGNKPGVDAQFNVDSEQLAFTPDPAKGESTYPTIFVEPAAVVVQSLLAHQRLDELWAYLPEALPQSQDLANKV